MAFTRALKYQLPLIRGEDVLELQRLLARLGHYPGQPDGLFGQASAAAVSAFQRAQRLRQDGVCGANTWSALQAAVGGGISKIARHLEALQQPHAFRDGCQWQLTPSGIAINGEPAAGTRGKPRSVRRIVTDFGQPIREWSEKYEVPAELIVATICTETSGDPNAVREEPGYLSDSETPHRVSPGLMQTLISTAQHALGDESVDRAWLLVPGNSIRAGTAYIASQYPRTHFDPPKVACAYNAGGVYYNDGNHNPWRMRQYPIGTGEHADRFVAWFNDAFKVFAELPEPPPASFYAKLQQPPGD